MSRSSGRPKGAKTRTRSTPKSTARRTPKSARRKKHPPPIRDARAIYSEHGLRSLSHAQDIARSNALKVLSLMRVEGFSLTRAAREVGLTREAARAWTGPTIHKQGRRYVVRPADKLVRKMAVLTPRGTIWEAIYDSRVASKLGVYDNAVKAALRSDLHALDPFRGKSFRTGGKREFPFLTNLRTLRRLFEAAELPEYQIYEPSTR